MSFHYHCGQGTWILEFCFWLCWGLPLCHRTEPPLAKFSRKTKTMCTEGWECISGEQCACPACVRPRVQFLVLGKKAIEIMFISVTLKKNFSMSTEILFWHQPWNWENWAKTCHPSCVPISYPGHVVWTGFLQVCWCEDIRMSQNALSSWRLLLIHRGIFTLMEMNVSAFLPTLSAVVMVSLLFSSHSASFQMCILQPAYGCMLICNTVLHILWSVLVL